MASWWRKVAEELGITGTGSWKRRAAAARDAIAGSGPWHRRFALGNGATPTGYKSWDRHTADSMTDVGATGSWARRIAEGSFSPDWVPDGAAYVWDFQNDRYWADGEVVSAGEAFSVSRSSIGMRINASGAYEDVAANNSRLDHTLTAGAPLGMLYEGAETYYVTNSEMQGAALGFLGSGGALPTGWLDGDIRNYGGTVQITQLGSSLGMGVCVVGVDVTNNEAFTFYPNVRITRLSTGSGHQWTSTVRFAQSNRVGNTVTGTLLELQQRTNDVWVGGTTLPLVNNASLRQSLQMGVTSGNQVDMYINHVLEPGERLNKLLVIMFPTMNRSFQLSSPRHTGTSSSVTRAAETMSLIMASGSYALTATFDDDSTQTGIAATGTLALPYLNRRTIRSIVAVPS